MNPRWLNAVASTLSWARCWCLSGVLVITTVFTHLHAGTVATLWLAIGLAAGVLIAGGWLRIAQVRRGPAQRPARVPREERSTWRTPPLALLKPVIWSPETKLAMIVLRGYLLISVLLLIVKAVQLGGG